MIDTHAHLDMCDDAPAEVLERATSAGVTRVVTVGTGIESGQRVLEIAESTQGVACALGVHPHDAGSVTAADLDELRRLLQHPAAVAVGETGLDYYRDYAPRESQSEVFAAHIALAVEIDKPLVIHSRAADDDTLDALATVPASTPVVLHCLSSLVLAEAAVERGYYVSFAGNVTYPNARELRAAARVIPSNRLLAETDAPYLAPQPVRGQRSEPAHVMHTLSALADTRRENLRALERTIDDNASTFFGIE